jgi:pimeloyl-ACP methyl ester carboxylesterase
MAHGLAGVKEMRLDAYAERSGRTLKSLHVPALVQVGRRDATVPPTPTIRAATSAPRTVLRVYDMGHFDAYTGDTFQTVIADQLSFLDHHFI